MGHEFTMEMGAFFFSPNINEEHRHLCADPHFVVGYIGELFEIWVHGRY